MDNLVVLFNKPIWFVREDNDIRRSSECLLQGLSRYSPVHCDTEEIGTLWSITDEED